MGPGQIQPENITWSRQLVGSPAAGIGIAGVRQGQGPRSADLWPCRLVKCHLSHSRRGAVPPTYIWAHLHTQHWIWNQTSGEAIELYP